MKYIYFVRGEAHTRLCETSIASVRRADRGAIIHVYSDEPDGPQFDRLLGARIHTLPAGQPMMLANLEAQCRAVCLAKPGEELMLLDTDILVTGDPPSGDFDLAVTWRDHVLKDEAGKKIEGVASIMPYNYGVIYARGGFAATECFFWLRERVRGMSSQLQQWYGNQRALALLAGQPPSTGEFNDRRTIPWTPTERGNPVWITKLPCETWNWTPQQPGEALTGKRNLHFKGKKRHLMEGYARALGLPWTLGEEKAA